MTHSSQSILKQISGSETKLGDLRAIAKEIKKDHALAMQLWQSGKLHPRLLSILIMDKKELTPQAIDNLLSDIEAHEYDHRLQLADWFMANQLMKDKKAVALIDTWADDPSALKRRIYWYYQGRLRWVGQPPPDNSERLISQVEKNMKAEAPEVQWAMNFTAGWIGVYEPEFRGRCILIGEKLGLYKDEVVHKGCTPNYLPEFIEIEAAKRKL